MKPSEARIMAQSKRMVRIAAALGVVLAVFFTLSTPLFARSGNDDVASAAARAADVEDLADSAASQAAEEQWRARGGIDDDGAIAPAGWGQRSGLLGTLL